MGSFNHLALSSLKIPDGVAKDVFETYWRSYSYAVVRNPNLGHYAHTLAKQFLDGGEYDSLMTMLATNSQAALEVVLNSDTTDHGLISHILDKWSLCVTDQLRLVGRIGLSTATASLIFGAKEISPVAKYEASARSGLMYTHSHSKPGERPRLEGHTRSRAHILPERTPNPRVCMSILHTGTTLPTLTAMFGNIHTLSGPMADALGREGPLAVNAWLVFFGLAESDPDVSVDCVMASARALARAEVVR